MQGPVLEYEADEEHEYPERPEDDDGRNFPVVAVSNPQPSQQEHG